MCLFLRLYVERRSMAFIWAIMGLQALLNLSTFKYLIKLGENWPLIGRQGLSGKSGAVLAWIDTIEKTTNFWTRKHISRMAFLYPIIPMHRISGSIPLLLWAQDPANLRVLSESWSRIKLWSKSTSIYLATDIWSHTLKFVVRIFARVTKSDQWKSVA